MPLDPTRPVDPGEIFRVALPERAGSEQGGTRLCVVMSRRAISTGNTLVVVPLTTNTDRARGHRIAIPESEILKDLGCLSEIKDCTALCAQVATVDKRYFENRIGKLSQNAVLAIQLGLSYVFEMQ